MTKPRPSSPGAPVDLFGARFEHPVLMAAGTAGFGEPLVDAMDPSQIGGLVTKSVTVEPKPGNPALRLVECRDGMLNSIGLANPGLNAVRAQKLPWMRRRLGALPVFISVAGESAQEYAEVVAGLDGEAGFLGFELNLSCPNHSLPGWRPFCLDRGALAELMALVRPLTAKPLLVKLAPDDPDIADTASFAARHGADGITAVNTEPVPPGGKGTSLLGSGSGGKSGPALLPAGLAAVRNIAAAVEVPVLGAGGILNGQDARAYLAAGASLVQVGTGSFADPRCAANVATQLRRAPPAP